MHDTTTTVWQTPLSTVCNVLDTTHTTMSPVNNRPLEFKAIALSYRFLFLTARALALVLAFALLPTASHPPVFRLHATSPCRQCQAPRGCCLCLCRSSGWSHWRKRSTRIRRGCASAACECLRTRSTQLVALLLGIDTSCLHARARRTRAAQSTM